MHNTIILTSGLTGSSVLAGLLASGGYWPGDRTYKKKDYDTFENEDLTRLNHGLLQPSSFHSAYQTTTRPKLSITSLRSPARSTSNRSVNSCATATPTAPGFGKTRASR